MRITRFFVSIADESGDSDSDEDEADPGKEVTAASISGGNSGVVKEVKRAKESKAAEAISALVNYVAAVRFHGFEHAECKCRFNVEIILWNYP